MDKVFVIFNPVAHGEKSQKVLKFLTKKVVGTGQLAPTRQAGDAKKLAAEAIAAGCDFIVAAGGDGTINEVVNGIARSGVKLGLLPLGTANVFAKELDIPGNIDAAWAVIENGKVRAIDLAQAEDGGVVRYFSQLAGVGFDAMAVRRASWRLKKIVGPLSYVWSGLRMLSGLPTQVEVCSNGSGPTARGAAVLIGNGRFYGGRYPMFPDARLDDGLLDICVFEKCGYFDVLRYAQGVLRGVHTGFKDVRYFQAEQFRCSAATPTAYEVDGEDAGDVPVKFSVVPRALRVVVPNFEGGIDHA